MIIYNIQTNGPSSQMIIELLNDGAYVEPKAVAYVVGDIELKANIEGVKNRLTAHFMGQKYFKPIFRGTGKIYLKPTLGSYHKFNVKEEDKLIIAKNSFLACRETIKIIPQVTPSLKKFLSGTPMINNLVSGHGNVVIQMPGPTVEEKLENSKFVAYDSNIAAYSASLNVTREIAGNGNIHIAHRNVLVFRGTGSIYFSPNINKDAKPCR